MSSEKDLLLRAARHAKEGKLEDALVELKPLLARDPKHVLALGMQAGIHAQLGMAERAAEGYRKLLDIDPSNPLARVQLAMLRMEQQDPQGALDMLQPALLQPKEFVAHYLAGRALLELDRIALAREQLELAARHMPPDHPLREALAEGLERAQGRA